MCHKPCQNFLYITKFTNPASTGKEWGKVQNAVNWNLNQKPPMQSHELHPNSSVGKIQQYSISLIYSN